MAGSENTPDLQEIHDFLVDLAFKAGKTINSALPTVSSTDSKKNSKSGTSGFRISSTC